MNIGLKFYDIYHFGKRRLHPCPVLIATRLHEHPKPGAGCDRAVLLGKTLLPGRLGMRVKGGISILVLAALVVLASFSRSLRVSQDGKLFSWECPGEVQKEKLRLLLCEPAPDIQQSCNSLLTGDSALCGFPTNPSPSSSVSSSGLSELSLIPLWVVSGEELVSSPDSSDSSVEFSPILLQFISREPAKVSKYSSSSAIASADEFAISRIILKWVWAFLGRGVEALSMVLSSSLSDDMSISSNTFFRLFIFFDVALATG